MNPLARLLKVKMKTASVNDVGSMSLSTIYPQTPNYYFISLLNSDLLFDYYRDFLNCTVNVQINDIRQMPILIPNPKQLDDIKAVFSRLYKLKKDQYTLYSAECQSEIDKLEMQMNVLVNELYSV